jgi:hypothetical protein
MADAGGKASDVIANARSLLDGTVRCCPDAHVHIDRLCAPLFHSVDVPRISGGDYLVQHLLRRGLVKKQDDLIEQAVLHVLLLIERLLCVQSPDGVRFHLCTSNVHRVLLATTLLSAKMLDDECYSNEHWAGIGGVTLPHMNRLEIELLTLLECNVFVTAPALEAVRRKLFAMSLCSQHDH